MEEDIQDSGTTGTRVLLSRLPDHGYVFKDSYTIGVI